MCKYVYLYMNKNDFDVGTMIFFLCDTCLNLDKYVLKPVDVIYIFKSEVRDRRCW